MPYTLKPNKIFAKDPNSDGYLPQNVVTDASTADQVGAIQTAGAQQVAAVEEKGEETLASIPADYTTLSGEVGDLKSALINFNAGNHFTEVTVGASTHNGVNWTVTGQKATARRTAASTSTSFYNIYMNQSGIPAGLTPGEKYYIKYKSNNIDFVVYDRSSGSLVELIRTKTDATITLPANITAMYLRLNISGGAIAVDSEESVDIPAFLSVKTNAELTNEKLDKRTDVETTPIGLYVPSGETFSVWTDMPNNSYITAYPAAFSASVDFSFSWRSGVSYKITKLNNVVYIFAISIGFSAVGIYNVSNGMQSWFTTDMLTSDDDAVQVYTDFTTSPLRWNGVVLGESSTLCHTNNFRVYPGRTYYLAQIGYTASGTLGCFLTMSGQPLAALTTANLSEEQYAYTTDNPNADYTRYTKLYKFTVPENCHYLSLNWSVDSSNDWRFFLASKPLFRLGNTGDLIIKKDSPLLQKANKRLCVIGPSYAMIDRRTQAAMNGQTTIGFQEYLWPYYQDITTFGYSGGAWGQIRDDEYISIYSGIVTGYGSSVLPKDFTPYDEVLLIGCNPNGFFSTPRQVEGEAGTWDANTSAVTTFMGGMRGVVEYILAQKPTMKIYLSNFWHTSGSVDATYRATCDTLNEEMLKLANLFGLQYIDLYNGTPFNKYNYTLENKLYSYDGVHPNQQGLMQIADVLVRAMVLGK